MPRRPFVRSLARAAGLQPYRAPEEADADVPVPSIARAHDREWTAAPGPAFAICSVPRTGSTLLCQGLWLSGVGGKPTEYLNPTYRAELMDRWRSWTVADTVGRWLWQRAGGKPPPDLWRGSARRYAGCLRRWRSGDGGVVGIKLQYAHWRQVLAPTPLHEWLPGLRYVFLTRRDHLRQAVSLARARLTGQYRLHDGAAPRGAGYDFAATLDAYRRIVADECGWRRYFERFAVEPLHVSYEDLIADHPGTLSRVLDHVGASGPRRLPAPAVRRQANEETESWLRRFRAELAARGERGTLVAARSEPIA